MKKRRNVKLLPDAKIKILNSVAQHTKLRRHNEAIQEIIAALSAAGINNINYDHIKSTIPKRAVPLYTQHIRFDISYIHSGKLVMIEVVALALEDVEILRQDDGNS
jgi:hypothetical protein